MRTDRWPLDLETYIDLETFRWEYGENYEFKLGHEENPERLLALDVEVTQVRDGVGAILRLGDGLQQGVEVTMTEEQRIDFLRTLRIMKYGRPSELPGDGSGYQRVGSNGGDTWDQGTEIEKEHNPEELVERETHEQSSENWLNNKENQSDSVTPGEEAEAASTTLLDRVRLWVL